MTHALFLFNIKYSDALFYAQLIQMKQVLRDKNMKFV